jgi:glutathione reductase (NADPH)
VIRKEAKMPETYELVVIGTGVAATKIAGICRKAGWRVAIADGRPFGGTCMLRGCDPKKLLWGVAATVDQAGRFAGAGFTPREIGLSWPELIAFKRAFLEAAPAAVENQLRGLGIDTFHGTARFVGRDKLSIDGKTLEARHVVIAAGSRPARLPIAGAEYLLTSDDFLEMDKLPETLLFVGGGYISFEFAHIAARAGAKVGILHEDDRPLAGFDRDLVARVLAKSRRIGIEVRENFRVESIAKTARGLKVSAASGDALEAVAVVHGAGRVPDIADLDLAAGGVEREGHRLRLTPQLQSVSNPAVYAAGDAAATGPMLTPVSELDAEVVAENLLSGPRRAPDYAGIPSVVFTIPPLAAVGMTEHEARERGRKFRVAQADISGWYSARRVREDTAAFKVLIEEGTSRILGAHIVGPNAEEAINPFALAVRLGITADRLRHMVAAYPSEGANIGYMLG